LKLLGRRLQRLALVARRLLGGRLPRELSVGEAPSHTFTQSIYGPYLRDTPADQTFELCVSGYGPFVADAIAGHNREFLFLDIGANLGLFSLLADRNPQCRKVLAFEPLPDIFRNLEANLVRNGAEKVLPICAAVGDAGGGDVYLSFNPGHSGMSKVLKRWRRGAVRARMLSAADLARLVPEWPASILAKIDVEGGEPGVLSVLRETPFYNAINALIIEISERNLGRIERRRLLDLLELEGFSETARFGPAEHYDALYRRTASVRPGA
jgi:FkbM family methyltransferase